MQGWHEIWTSPSWGREAEIPLQCSGPSVLACGLSPPLGSGSIWESPPAEQGMASIAILCADKDPLASGSCWAHFIDGKTEAQ